MPQMPENMSKQMAKVAAELYAALLNMPIPKNTRAVIWFTPNQAFTLVNTMFYEGLKDEGLL